MFFLKLYYRCCSYSGIAALVSLAALSFAIQLNNGAFHRSGIVALTIASAFILGGPFVGVPRAIRRHTTLLRDVLFGLFFIWAFAEQFTTKPGIYLAEPLGGMLTYHVLIVCAALMVGLLFVFKKRSLAVPIVALFIVYALLAVWIIRSAPNPHIDLYRWSVIAFNAAASGKNPYALTMPNIYGHLRYYSPQYASRSIVNVGYHYPPLTFLLSWLGYAVAGDYRYAAAAAFLVSAVLLIKTGRNRVAVLSAFAFLFTPRSLFVLEQGWTEPFVILSFALVVFSATRRPAFLPYAMGLFVTTKQYGVLCVPLLFLLLASRMTLSFLVKAGTTAAVPMLPFALGNMKAFWRSLVAFHVKQPFRRDSLSFIAYWTDTRGAPRLPLYLNFPVAIAVMALQLWRAPRNAYGFATATSAVMLFFFAFGKQAFCNYYFAVIGMLAFSLALADQGKRDTIRASN